MGWQLFRDREDGMVDDVDDDFTEPYGEDDASFWASPVGRAARARLRGDRFFQIELDDVTLAAYAESKAAAGSGRRARRTCDLLGQIEELGWHLEHVSWWRVDPSEAAQPHVPGAQDARADSVRGVYLFHSVPVTDGIGSPEPQSPNGSGHSPTHRRDVG
jgi:hypothetical protein